MAKSRHCQSLLYRFRKQHRLLSKVYRFIQTGWLTQIPDEDIKPYWLHQSDLTVECNWVMYGIRVVIPRKLQEPILQELHSTHPGIQRMKAWLRLRHRTTCESMYNVSKSEARTCSSPFTSMDMASSPLAEDPCGFCRSIFGYFFPNSGWCPFKWPEVIETSSITAAKTIQVMRHLFSQYGLPQQLVSDNGPQFVSEEFGFFLSRM